MSYYTHQKGVGKTTFGVGTPNPLFICTERGTDNFEVPRVNCTTWNDVKDVFSFLLKEEHEFNTIVVDTVDWLESMMVANICEENNKKSIEDFGFGKRLRQTRRAYKAIYFCFGYAN